MSEFVKTHRFKDGKVMYEDRIAYANGDYVSREDYDKLENKRKYLQAELEKTYNQLMEVEKDAQEHIAKLEAELETKDNLLEIKNGLLGNNDELPTDPIAVVQMLIDAKYVRKTNAFDRFRGYEGDTMEVEKYSIDDLEQIAEHLLVYCKHNREDEG